MYIAIDLDRFPPDFRSLLRVGWGTRQQLRKLLKTLWFGKMNAEESEGWFSLSLSKRVFKLLPGFCQTLSIFPGLVSWACVTLSFNSDTQQSEKCNVGAGLHKLWYPIIQDTSTWSEFGAHGKHGDVFLFSNLGALWFSESLIRYSLHVCLREVKNNLFSFKHSHLRHFSWRF